MEPNIMPTVAIYSRMSKAKTQATGKALKDLERECLNQLLQLREFGASRGWTVAPEHEFLDVASGSTNDRPRLNDLLAAARRKEVDLVLFWSIDRWTRTGSRECLNLLYELEVVKCDWLSYSEQWLEGAGSQKDFMVALMANMAKQERLRIGERTKAGLARKRAEGVVLGRPRGTGKIIDASRLSSLRAQGLSSRACSKLLGVSHSTIQRRAA
jgi:DNA invertase Pin-like site-specific DNA recombinase